MKLIFVDIETTGLSPEHERITELALLFSDGRSITGRKVWLVNPEMRIPEMITNLTGISNESVKHAPRFCEIAREVVELTEGATLVGHNVRFDYSFLVAEFRRLGFKFNREHACTISLARKHFPGFKSYGLKKVCDELKIDRPDLFARTHRADTDAELCFEVFARAYTASGANDLDAFFKAEARPRHVPALMKQEDIAAIPKAVGVYYFYDDVGALLYVGKSVNLRERVISHFQSDLRDDKERRIKERVARVNWQLAPTELAALLLEAEEIKRLKPHYNRLLRENKQNFGLYLHQATPFDPVKLYVQPHAPESDDGAPVKLFKTRGAADRYLDWLAHEHGLCENLFFRGGRTAALRPHALRACFGRQIERCTGVCDGTQPIPMYNTRVRQLFANGVAAADPSSYLLCEKVKGEDHWVVVWIDRGVYRGWGSYRGRMSSRSLVAAQRAVETRPENADIYRILRSYRLGEAKLRIYPLADAEQTSLYQLA